MNVLDLFSGIGGFSLGLERAGMKTVAFCEIEEFPRKVLAKHWPDVPIYEDVRTREFKEGEADVIAAGFPCQDISFAGEGSGTSGSRSGLYREVVRAIRVVRPQYTILENVAALLSRGMGDVLGDLAEVGQDAEWDCIQACDVGLPHARDRAWIVAHSDGVRELQPQGCISDERRWAGDESEAVNWVLSSGGILRSDDGIPASLDRIGACGNAVVPRIPELIGRAIMAEIEAAVKEGEA